MRGAVADRYGALADNRPLRACVGIVLPDLVRCVLWRPHTWLMLSWLMLWLWQNVTRLAPEQRPRASPPRQQRGAVPCQRPPLQFRVGQSVFALPLRFGRARRRVDSFRFWPFQYPFSRHFQGPGVVSQPCGSDSRAETIPSHNDPAPHWQLPAALRKLTLPAGMHPRGAYPAGTYPAGAYPAGAYPAGTCPCLSGSCT